MISINLNLHAVPSTTATKKIGGPVERTAPSKGAGLFDRVLRPRLVREKALP